MKTQKEKMNNLLEVFLLLEDKKQALAFFEDIFTPQEIEALMERWEIVKTLLGTDLPQREVAQKIGCSVALVSRASRQIQYGSGGFLAVYSKLKK
jgi:Trp operon repressor